MEAKEYLNSSFKAKKVEADFQPELAIELAFNEAIESIRQEARNEAWMPITPEELADLHHRVIRRKVEHFSV